MKKEVREMGEKEAPFVSVVSAVRNEERYIEELLTSLKSLDYPKNKYEIIIADGMSDDKTREIASKFKGVKIIGNINKKTPFGRNLAIKKAKGKYVAITDGDCKVDVQWLKILANKIKDSPENVVAVGGPNLVFDNDPTIARVVGFMQETFLGSGGSPQSYKIKEEKEVYSIPNCNIIYKKNVLIENKLFDENFDLGEDGELNHRLRKKGYKFVYTPNAIVWHHRRDSIKRLARGMFVYGRERARVIKKHKKIDRWFALIPSLFVLFVIFSLFVVILINNSFLSSLILEIYLLYGVLIFFSSLSVFNKMGFNPVSFLSMLLLPIQHISYGLGFLWGLGR